MKTILIIDDEEKIRSLLTRIIRAEGFEVLEAPDGRTGLKKFDHHEIDTVLCDVKLPDTSGVELTKQIKTLSPFTEIILFTAYGNINDGVQAIKNGAFDYIIKGDDNDKIIPLIYRSLEKVELAKRVRQLEKQLNEKHSFDTILGTSRSIKAAIELARKVAPTDAAVLLTGETGTGKEIFANAIHQASPRAAKSFVALNCSTFSREMMESELFGHKQGSFTGAIRDKKGLVEEANGGTLFLDEIGEMPLELQAKLLRVLENNEFIKLGDTKPVKSNFRLIAATNKDLLHETEEKHFRADLYFRLNVFQITLPPLRERSRDIGLLAGYFAERYAGKINKGPLTLDTSFIQKLEAYPWNGNIRELKNVIERAVILVDGLTLTADLLPFDIQQYNAADHLASSSLSMSAVEKLHIQKVLFLTRGNKTEAARLLEIGIATLYRKIEEYGI